MKSLRVSLVTSAAPPRGPLATLESTLDRPLLVAFPTVLADCSLTELSVLRAELLAVFVLALEPTGLATRAWEEELLDTLEPFLPSEALPAACEDDLDGDWTELREAGAPVLLDAEEFLLRAEVPVLVLSC